MVLGSTQPVRETSTRKIPGDKGRRARKADNLTAVSRLARNCGNLNVSQPYGPPRPVIGIVFFLILRTF
jgi:hypothetical protein